MPDMERTLRSLELHLTKTPEQKAYTQGLHDGMNKARIQIVGVAVLIAVLVVLVAAKTA